MNASDSNCKANVWLDSNKVAAVAFLLAGGALSFVPWYYIGQLIAPIFGVVVEAPIIEQDRGLLFLNVMVVLMLACCGIGMFFGLVVVAWRLASSIGCSTSEALTYVLRYPNSSKCKQGEQP